MPGGNSHQRKMWRRALARISRTQPEATPKNMAVAAQPVSDSTRLSKGDSYTYVGMLVGGILMVISPTLIFRIAGLVVLCIATAWFFFHSYWTAAWKRGGKITISGLSVLGLCAISIPQFVEEYNRQIAKPIMHILDFHPKYGRLEGKSGYRAWIDIDNTNTAAEQAWGVFSISRVRLIPFPAGKENATTMESQIFGELGKDQSLYLPSNMAVAKGVPYLIHAVSEEEIPEKGHEGKLGIDDLDAGRASIFLGGLIRYKDQKGCVYQTYYCGFWRGAGGGKVYKEMNSVFMDTMQKR